MLEQPEELGFQVSGPFGDQISLGFWDRLGSKESLPGRRRKIKREEKIRPRIEKRRREKTRRRPVFRSSSCDAQEG